MVACSGSRHGAALCRGEAKRREFRRNRRPSSTIPESPAEFPPQKELLMKISTCFMLTLLFAVLAAPLVAEIEEAKADAVTESAVKVEEPKTEESEKATEDGDDFDLYASLGETTKTYASSCSAWATCHDGSLVDCSTTSGSCQHQDASCPGQRGFVTCGSTTKNCPACPVQCPDPNCQQGSACSGVGSCGPCGYCSGGTCNCLM